MSNPTTWRVSWRNGVSVSHAFTVNDATGHPRAMSSCFGFRWGPVPEVGAVGLKRRCRRCAVAHQYCQVVEVPWRAEWVAPLPAAAPRRPVESWSERHNREVAIHLKALEELRATTNPDDWLNVKWEYLSQLDPGVDNSIRAHWAREYRRRTDEARRTSMEPTVLADIHQRARLATQLASLDPERFEAWLAMDAGAREAS